MKNKYTFGEFFSNVFSLLATKLFYRPARLIRRPVYIRGKKSLVIGKGLTTGHSCRFDLDGNKKTLFIGDNCEFGDNTHIVAYNRVNIGNNVLIASKVFISDTSHGSYKGNQQDSPATNPSKRPLIKSSVTIGDNVWIGENVVILPGVEIGQGCIIGANSVVTKDLDENSIYVGSPAKKIKEWNNDIEKWVSIDGK